MTLEGAGLLVLRLLPGLGLDDLPVGCHMGGDLDCDGRVLLGMLDDLDVLEYLDNHGQDVDLSSSTGDLLYPASPPEVCVTRCCLPIEVGPAVRRTAWRIVDSRKAGTGTQCRRKPSEDVDFLASFAKGEVVCVCKGISRQAELRVGRSR